MQELPTTDDLFRETPLCPDFAQMYKYLTVGELPDDDSAARRLTLEASNYVVHEGVLLHLFTPRTKRLDRANAVIRQVCVPRRYRPDIARALHDENCHVGFDRLYSTARLRYYFPGMYTFLHDHVRTCMKCQTAKRPIHPGQAPVGALPVVPPGARWIADFHGPFRESNNRKFTMTIIDSASLWPELIAVPDVSAETVVQTLFDSVISRYGWPKEIALQTDNGSGFVARLTSLFCKTFNIKQHFSTAYHPQSQSKVEAFADTIHKSLRVLCAKQSDWSKHLSAVAMSYRASATTSLGFGRPFKFAIDQSLSTPEALASNPEAYATEIKPKLDILSQLAMQNARESADKHRERANKNASEPAYEIGDKVLLYNPVTRKNESAKLTVRYTGPFLITDVDERRNYSLQLLSTGKDLRRPVHVSRLRLLLQLDNDYRVQQCRQQTAVYEVRTDVRGLRIRVQTNDPLEQAVDAIAVSVDEQLRPTGEADQLVCDRAGPEVQQECSDKASAQPRPKVVVTAAGGITSAKQLLLAINTQPDRGAAATCDSVTYEALCTADRQPGIKTLLLLFPNTNVQEQNLWQFAMSTVQAAKQFERDTKDQHGELNCIIFSCKSLLHVDVLGNVLKQAFQVPDDDQLAEPLGLELLENKDSQPVATDKADSELKPTDEWYAVKRIIKQRKRKNKVQYLVEWEGSTENTWVNRSDISDFAVQAYLASRKHKKRRAQ